MENVDFGEISLSRRGQVSKISREVDEMSPFQKETTTLLRWLGMAQTPIMKVRIGSYKYLVLTRP